MSDSRSLLFLMALVGCSDVPMGHVRDGGALDLSADPCAGAPATTLDEIWTKYLASPPSSGVGGCVAAGCHGDGQGNLFFSTPEEFVAATVNIPGGLLQQTLGSPDLLGAASPASLELNAFN